MHSTPQKNVLFLCFDDLNDWLGCLGGHPQVQTPNIDRLAKQGVLFRNAHCQAPICTPSRNSVLTGRRPTSTGIYGLQPGIRNVPELRSLVTLPQHFGASGYKTMAAGKIFHDGQGGGEWNGPTFVGGYKNVPKKKLAQPSADPNPLMDWGVWPERDEDHDDTQLANWAEARLAETAGSDTPWFLGVGFRSPHVPCYASQKWFDLYPETTLRLPEVAPDDRSDTPEFSWYLHWSLPEPRRSWLEKNQQWKPLVRSYLASISFVDSLVGRVLLALERSGQANNTLIVLWSDHGWHLGEKEISGKNSLWEESTHVPLIIAGPGIRPGRCDQSVELLDLFPTLCELASLPMPAGLEGHSLLPQLKRPGTKRAWPAITTHNPGNHSVRTNDWRYIRYADGSEELYDRRNDPNEWTNLAARPERAKLKTELAQWLPKTEKPHVPNSQSRILTKRSDGKWLWEGKPILPEERQL
jgi:choline-sulfatase